MAPFSAKVRYIAEQLYRSCVEPDTERVRVTGAIPPNSTLRHAWCKQAFSWCENIHEPRYFTRGAVKGALIRLLDFYGVEVPVFPTPGLTRCDWIRAQTRWVHHLCKRAVKNCNARQLAAMACLDNVETQVLEDWSILQQHCFYLELLCVTLHAVMARLCYRTLNHGGLWSPRPTSWRLLDCKATLRFVCGPAVVLQAASPLRQTRSSKKLVSPGSGRPLATCHADIVFVSGARQCFLPAAL